ncbi:hypothetical protein [uncultured Azohydromonas sp.]|jgi:hypothetical protein|uniref:hypothetical protein n=1 Tax=uncultured Azohydromonas sp. TaxID=487342 RepID=UPI002606EB0B|nr:hypothetical protein [uncultured Azohydromonas sp.]
MSNALGPVIGNRLADARRAMLKPHLRERLALLASRSTPLGTINADEHGRLSFAPKDDPLRGWDRIEGDGRPMPRSAFRPGQRVRVDATVGELLTHERHPFEPDEAAAVAGREGVVIGHPGCALLGLVLVRLDSEHWTFLPEYLVLAPPAEGDDEHAAMTSSPAFDPYGEPLALGDTVQGMDGRIGRVSLIKPQRLGVVFERGGAWCGDMSCRGSFRLLVKASAWECPNGCPF